MHDNDDNDNDNGYDNNNDNDVDNDKNTEQKWLNSYCAYYMHKTSKQKS